ncbi:MAG: CDP-diacylglycerol--glycerol-3-phosphate 3-phosphatidyltransferase [Ignavibacteria bacterium]|nr:CDP-diacylglycerol--glycerol-3-phosphate 3-phosphatidyltransferase [Ignavibacteria bacterium]
MHFTLPNFISFLRVLLAPVFFVLLRSESQVGVRFAVLVFIIGAMSDYFDGYFARRWKQVSAFGAFFDPLADKVLTAIAFFAFASLDIISYWMVLIVVARDIITTLLRVYADSIDNSIVTSSSAKLKTFLQMIFISYLLLLFALKGSSEFPPNFRDFFGWLLVSDATHLMMLALTLYTVWTTILYLITNISIVKQFWRNDAVNVFRMSFVSVFGVGFLPKMPGTYGSLAALLILFTPITTPYLLLLSVICFIAGLILIGDVERTRGADAHCIVIDEVIGMWLVLCVPYIPHNWFWVSLGFIIFRCFDIFKPFPINRINSRRGAFWVLADDILAAIYAGLALYLFWMTSLCFPLVLAFVNR